MGRAPWQAFLLQAAAVDAGAVLAFFVLHQLLLAWTWAPLLSLLHAFVPALFVVAAFRAWRWSGPARGTRFGATLALCGALPWAAALALFWGRPVGLWSVAVDLTAAALGAAAALLATRRLPAALWTAAAVLEAFGFASPFLGSGPVRWVEARALVAFSLACVAGGATLGWATARMEAGSPMRPEVAA